MPGVFVNMAFTAMFFKLVAATNYIVGAPNGSWDLNTNFQKWASSNTFLLRDNLIFQYTPMHDVAEVSKLDYDSCQADNAIQSDGSGVTEFALTKPGKRYFICGIPGHCAQGMKMEVETLASVTPAKSNPSNSPASSPAGTHSSPHYFRTPFTSLQESPSASPSPSPPLSTSTANVNGCFFQPVLAIGFAVGFIMLHAF
ncbi:hypothetical protein Nepgr_000500 [Nepenthes gracilis]|uniref:Phytocyanin domain-containing protein n=1 Tax=Nepenthes gracilis TaxID=150966 RepID=A0AAD3P352_NEPGR|nr:hypothetical protein Nepgr_000500 [Nepenthes gracilis]